MTGDKDDETTRLAIAKEDACPWLGKILGTYIELKYGDKTMLVSHGDTDMRNKWISLLRSNADAMRAKATTKNRRRSTAMTKGGTRRRSSFSPTSTPNESVQNTPVQTSRRLSKS